MLVGKTRNDIDKLLDLFWTNVTSNPLTVIEQITYLIFIRRLDDIETKKERQSKRTGKKIENRIFPENTKNEKFQDYRWSNFKQTEPEQMLKTVRDGVFPFMKNLATKSEAGSTITEFAKKMKDATFLVQKPSVLATAVSVISDLDLDNADTSGDLYEYILNQLTTSGKNGQFRTPRHIIRMMVEIIDPGIEDRICDPACGTGGFLFTSINYIKEKYTSEEMKKQGFLHVGDKLKEKDFKKFQNDTFYGFDFDSSMLQIAAMNLWLHGVEQPNIHYADSLSKSFEEKEKYSVILANPPFKGSLNYEDVNPDLISEIKTKKTELLFLELTLRLLDMGGRCAIIVPDGVLFGSSNAHKAIREKLVEHNQLEGVIGMPSGVFKPYAGVSTAILIFTKGGKTDKVWFYDMEHDGYSLDDRRQLTEENDIPDIINCWNNRTDKSFQTKAEKRMNTLREKMAPLKKERLRHEEEINRLQFESVINEVDEKVKAKLEKQKKELKELEDELHVFQKEFNQISRQFWVEKKEIVDNKYDLSTSRYREIEQDEVFYDKPNITLRRIEELNKACSLEVKQLLETIK